MITFYSEPTKQDILCFSDVEEDQFFICGKGQLCQKVGWSTYIIIARSDGFPHADIKHDVVQKEKIARILPKVTKISWE